MTKSSQASSLQDGVPMTYEPLHHKYRPQTFGDLVGQSAIAQTLINAIKQEKIAPAYLFTGPRGTGKTSSARILAKSLNCLKTNRPTPDPCGECEVCKAIATGTALDIIEIDAASNTGVDNIREIIERSQFAPVQSRYKVYAIDECLTGDSLIQTNKGLMRLDNPKLKGKLVLSYNENTQGWEYKKVLRWLERGTKETLAIKTSNHLIRCTKNHLIYTDKGWIEAKNVKEGMKILSPVNLDAEKISTNTAQTEEYVDFQQDISLEVINKNTQFPQWTTNLEKVEFVRQGGHEKVYDLEVEDNHNFVANGLLVHNCHMLSTAAFNALLKTLEEPPPRVVFILATTDPQRVLPTIISRCQRFDYRRIPLEEMVNHLEYIAQKEKIEIDAEAIRLVGQVANGGLRDAESLLDQLSLFPEKITIDQVWDLVGAIPERDLLSLLQEIRTKNFAGVLSQCRNLLDRGREPITVLQNLASFYLNLLIAQSAPQSSNLVAVTEDCWTKLKEEATQWQQETILWGQQKLKEAETQIKNTTQPRLWLEVTLLGLLSEATVTSSNPQNISVAHSATETVAKQNEPSPAVQPITENKQDSKKEIPQEEQTEKVVPLTPTQPTVIVREQSPINSKVVPITKNQSVTENPVTSRSEVDIQTIWQKAIAILEPPTTRSLLNQKCHLISLEDSQAIIGISAPPLLRLLQGKAANIEAAFTQVCQRKIKVTLQIASAQEVGDLNETRGQGGQGGQGDWGDKEARETRKEAISSESYQEIIPNIEKHTPVESKSIIQKSESPKPLLNGNHGERVIASDRKILPQQDPIPPIIETSSEISHPSEYQVDSESSEGDFAKAVELIAQNFDGEIITLDDYFYNTESEDISPPAIESEENLPPEATNDNELLNNQKNACPSIITNRPDSSQYDDEDVPFARPINFAARELKLQDCWELAINEPRKTFRTYALKRF